MNILGVITARGGSRGIAGKNIKVLGNKPLIAYTIEATKKSKLLSRTIVSTDDAEIAGVCREYEAEVPFMRPQELAQDDTPHVPVMQHAIDFMEKRDGITFDYAVIFQPTSPFRTVDDIDGTIEKLIETGADSAVAICEWTDTNPFKAKRLEGDRVLPYFEAETSTQRQDLPRMYKRSGAVYAIKRDTIMEGTLPHDLYGRTTVGYEVPVERSIDIDTPLDWVKAEYMLRDLNNKGYNF